MVGLVTNLLPTLLVALYTFHYGRWAWKQNLKRGAVGVMLLALATIALPAAMLLLTR